MQIQCNHCGSLYQLDTNKVPEGNSFVRCSDCQKPIPVQKDTETISNSVISECPNCQIQYAIPDDKFKSEQIKVSCGSCGHHFKVDKAGEVSAADEATEEETQEEAPSETLDMDDAADLGFEEEKTEEEDLPLDDDLDDLKLEDEALGGEEEEELDLGSDDEELDLGGDDDLGDLGGDDEELDLGSDDDDLGDLGADDEELDLGSDDDDLGDLGGDDEELDLGSDDDDLGDLGSDDELGDLGDDDLGSDDEPETKSYEELDLGDDDDDELSFEDDDELSFDDDHDVDIEDETEESPEEDASADDEYMDSVSLGDEEVESVSDDLSLEDQDLFLQSDGVGDDEPEATKKPEKKSKEKKSKLLPILLIVLALIAGGWFFLESQKPAKAPVTGSVKQKTKQTPRLTLLNIDGILIKNSNFKNNLFVITGTVKNLHEKGNIIRNIKVQGSLYNENNRKVASAEGFAGPVLSQSQLAVFSKRELLRELKSSSKVSPIQMGSGFDKHLDFQILFFNPPKQIHKLEAKLLNYQLNGAKETINR